MNTEVKIKFDDVMSKEEEYKTFSEFVSTESRLINHCLNHHTFSTLRKKFKDLASINEARFNERKVIDEILTTSKSLALEEKNLWSTKFKNYSNKNSVILNKCVTTNVKLVMFLARRWYRNSKSSVVTLDDLVQEGYIGLMKAIVKFNPKLGFRFFTYAAWWVKQSMRVHTDEGINIIRIPHNSSLATRKVIKEHELRAVSGDESSLKDLIKERGLNQKTVDSSRVRVVSIDDQIPGLPITISDRLTNDDLSPHEELEHKELLSVMRESMNFLNSREREIILMRFGFKSDEKTLQEIGDGKSLTRERIRQIENAGLKRLRLAASTRGSKRVKEFFVNASYD